MHTQIQQFMTTMSLGSAAVRLLLAALFGFVIGLDRELRSQSAGVRTHILVSVGSALTMLVGQYAYLAFPGANIDVTRIGSYVVSGIGFLGVGMIIVTDRNRVHGIASAAGLWACACVGLAVGIGFLDGALIAVAIIVVSLLGMHGVDKALRKRSRHFTLFLELTEPAATKRVIKSLREMDADFSNLEFAKSRVKGDGPTLMVTVDLGRSLRRADFLGSLEKNEDILFYDIS